MHKELNVIYLDKVDSTNKYALRNFADLPDSTLIVASEQSSGRGRHERQWLSPPNTNIYASMIIKDIGENPTLASMIASLGALSALRASAPDMKFWLKWPNDIFCRERKIAGILCESASDSKQQIAGIVAGIGINVNMPTDIINSIDQPATSLMHETDNKFNLKKVVKKLAKSLKKYYNIYSISPEVLFTCWKDENLLIGQTVEVNTGEKEIEGKIIDLGNNGELIFESSGKQIKLFSGDVKINKNSIDFAELGLI
ncbi:MAG: biotin--[acetyl-CoA-carboxylase] ligase [Victivallales bacterium]|nr:biotin--[acetyl-CoA-carboxylase] ligase [Victivallales bacterium]